MSPRLLTKRLQRLISYKQYNNCINLCLAEKYSFNIIHLSMIMEHAEQFNPTLLERLLQHVDDALANQDINFYVVDGCRDALSGFFES